jgi:CobQ-like glutamine amidotransferase family enzyme
MLIVSRVIGLAALYPEHLNLNGDHANLLVLQKRLQWRNIESQIVSVARKENLDKFDLLVLGHGSADAWAELSKLDSDLIPRVLAFINSGKPVIAVSSGYEFLVEEMNSLKVKHIERVSEFQDFGGIVGYINSEADLPAVTWVKNSLLTLFHGPVLAKNPELADQIIENANWASNEKGARLENVDSLAEASRRIAFED